jgi:hypothetical protein
VALEGLLCHTVQVYRRTVAEDTGERKVDRFGQQLATNPQQHQVDGQTLHATYRCRVTRSRGGLLQEERMVDVFQQMWTMYTDLDVDIMTDDAVRVLDENGNELVPRAKIKTKSTATGYAGSHHFEYQLWAQSGAGNV